MIENKSIEELKSRIDLAELISYYIEVKRQGSSYVCLCPFHDDNSPSMHINVEKGFYHCFACKAGGDGIRFVMEYEKLGFSEAVEKIASIFNFTLNYTSKNNNFNKNDKLILPLLNSFYKEVLKSKEIALNYLYERGLEKADIRRFELGFAPNSNESLRLLLNEKIDCKDALKVGALKLKNNNFYASFINRITFPIYDQKDLLVGFGGRTLDKNNPAKYVNSPSTNLFDKSRLFYALNLAKEEAIKSGWLMICEGYMDVIAFHKMGFTNTVAVLGTALTSKHLPLIKRLDVKVVLCFDSDEAGVRAAFKSARLLSLHKIEGSVISLKGGKDAAQLLQEKRFEEVNIALREKEDLCRFYARTLILQKNPKSTFEKEKCLEELREYAFGLPAIVARELEGFCASLLGVLKKDVGFVKGESDNKTLNNYQSFEQYTLKDVTQLELLKYIYDKQNKEYFEYFLSSKAFWHQSLLKAIYLGKGVDDENIRKMLFANINDYKDLPSFIDGCVRLNLNYLEELRNNKEISLKDSFVLNILDLINKNFALFKSSFTDLASFANGYKALINDLKSLQSKDDAKAYLNDVLAWLNGLS